MSFLNEDGQVKNLSLEDIPAFIKEYLENFAKPLTVAQPELSKAFQLFPVIDDLDAILEEEADLKVRLPLLFMLWTNLVARMARIETISTAQKNYEVFSNVEQEENKKIEEVGG